MSDIEVFLDAFGKRRRVGLLRRHAKSRRERVTYDHDPGWLASPEAFQFDPSLPLDRGIIAPPDGQEMFGSLGDSAPDSWGRRLMRRNERRNAEREGRQPRTLHETDYLLGVSDETRLGALRFRFEGEEDFRALRQQGVPATTALEGLAQASQRVLDGTETDDDLNMVFAPGSSLGGARPKASVKDRHGHLSIAKFPKEADRHCVSRWEAIALDLAQACGIRTAEHHLESSSVGPIFVSRRFDRMGADRIPFMSAMSMTQRTDADRDGSYLEILEAITERGAQPERDREELFRRIAFSILASNIDDHLRNHGFLWTGEGGWELSPCYDVNPVPDSQGILSTRIDLDDSTASLRLLQNVAEFFVRPADADRIIRDCAAVTATWREAAARRHAPEAEIRLMETAFEHDELNYALRL